MVQTQIRNNRIFGGLLLLTETILIFMFGFFQTYAPNRQISDDYYIISSFFILALCGFGLITGYIKSSAIASLVHVLIIMGLSLQLYFPFRGFWQIIGLSGMKWVRDNDDILPISVTNVLNDRLVSQMQQSSALTDYIACFISLVIVYSSVAGRIGNLQTYFLTVIGTFIYEFNSMIFWRIFITDCGFGMRIFLFGGFFGLLFSSILGNKQSTVAHAKFRSDYYHQALNLFGAIVIWCLFPILNWTDLWHRSTIGTDSFILHVVSLNMWLALCGSAIGAYCGCIVLFKKLSVHTIIFSVFSGGIGYTSISNIYYNPGLAMGIGTITGFISAIAISKINKKMNQNGVSDSNGVVSTYLIPGLIAAILSAIFQANGANSDANYNAHTDPSRTRFSQGGIQVAGLGIAIGLGIFAGIVTGLLSRLVNKRVSQQQFQNSFIVNEHPVNRDGEQIA